MTYTQDNTRPAPRKTRDAAGLPTKTLVATFAGEQYVAEREGDELRVFLISDGQLGSVAVADKARHEAVGELVADAALAEALHETLKRVYDVERLLHSGLEILAIQLVALRIVRKTIGGAGIVNVAQLDDDLGRPVIAVGCSPGDVDRVGIEVSGLQLATGIHAFDFEDVAAVRSLPFANQLR